MTPGSSLPPLQKNDGKYGLIALLLLLSAGGLWFFFKTEDPPPQAEAAEPVPEAPAREQFAAEIEIPEEDAGPGDVEDAPPASKPGRSSRPEDWACRGNLQAAQLSAVIKGQPSKQVQTCYERALKDNNLLQGSMTVLLTIGMSGGVRAVSVDGTLRDRQVYACVKRVARTWKFPKPSDGCVRTSVPFQMMPKL